MAETADPKNAKTTNQAALEASIAALASTVREGFEKIPKPAAEPAKPEKTYTRSELTDAVARGQITQAQADAMFDDQLTKRITKEVTTKVREEVSGSNRDAVLNGEFDRYKAAVPDVLIEGSATRKRIAEEWDYLTGKLGYPKTVETELFAMHAVLGSIEAVERAAKAKEVSRETHVETGGGDGGSGGEEAGAPRNLPNHLRAYYATQIDNGRYSGWDDKDLVAELGYLKAKRVRAA